jgi:hypothetical protein
VCDLETSRIGASYIYIYDISNLRVNALLSSRNKTSAKPCLLPSVGKQMFFIALRNYDPSVTRMDAIIDLEVKLLSKLHFYPNVDCIFSHSVRMLGLIRIIPAPFLLVTVYWHCTELQVIETSYASTTVFSA